MVLTELFLGGAFKIDLDYRKDDRGFFARLFCEQEFSTHGLDVRIVQINNSLNTSKGTLRGLHFQQPPKTEIKVVRCLRGAIWDVIVDLRRNSKTFGKWIGLELNEENRSMMYVPKGFAHGFLSLTVDSEIVYCVTEPFSPKHEGAVRWDDPIIGIEWPENPLVMSEKDANAPLFDPNMELFSLY
jgi:dTDP-4-dehydrorhamnose 3,5-epimerase